jgi:hypothetical protein
LVQAKVIKMIAAHCHLIAHAPLSILRGPPETRCGARAGFTPVTCERYDEANVVSNPFADFRLDPQQISSIQSALSVLTSMITPALLISAGGTFIMSTSIRLGRVVDRARVVAERYEELMLKAAEDRFASERQEMFNTQLGHLSRRGDLLQRALSLFYLASGTFVLSSISIAFSILFRATYWLPVFLGLMGAALLFWGMVLMVSEMRLALRSLREETDFHLRLAKRLPGLFSE